MGSPSSQSLGKAGGLAVVSSSLSASDSAGKADRIVSWIEAPRISWLSEWTNVEEIMDPIGAKPGFAKFAVSVATGHEKMNAVALGAPWKDILHGASVALGRQRAGYQTHWFWLGKVAIVDADLESDSLLINAKDWRCELTDVRMVGSFVVEPNESSNNIKWRQGWPPVFNEGGRPNMMLSKVTDADGVLIPGFAPAPDYGLEDDTEPNSPEVSKEQCQLAACYWTFSWIMRYLSIFYGPGASSYYTGAQSVPKLCPTGIHWPRGLGAQVDSESDQYWDEGRGQSRGSSKGERRKGRELNADGMSVLDVIELMVSTAGGYSIGWEMRGAHNGGGGVDPTSVLSLVPSTYRGGVGRTLDFIQGGTVDERIPNVGGRYFTKGHYLEDSSDMVTSAYAVGSLVKIERRVDTTVYLKRKWSDDEEEALRTTGDAQSVATAEGARKLFGLYPQVCAYYALDEDFDFQENTSEANEGRAAIPRPIMPHLLSWIGGVALDYAMAHHPVRVEVSDDGGTTWVPTTELMRLSVLDDGTIDLTALRELAISTSANSPPGSWFWDDDADPWTWNKFAPTDIRMTVAIPCDHRLTAVCKLVGDNLTSTYDDLVQSIDADRIHSSLEQQNVLDLRGLYHLWLRYGSYPRPASSFSEPQAEDRNTRENALRNDHALLRSHVRRHMYLNGKLKRGGYLSSPQILTTIMQGAQIQNLRRWTGDSISSLVPLHCSVRARRFIQSESSDVDVET